MERTNPKIIHVLGRELKAQLFANHRRVVKFVAICFVPFLYGFICCWAFWNPFLNVDKVPMAIVNHDANQALIINQKTSTKNNSIVDEIENNPLIYPYQYNNKIQNYLFSFNNGNSNVPISITNNAIPYLPTYNKQQNSLYINKDEIHIKLQYLTGKKTIFHPENKYWVQLRIPQNYSEHVIKLLIQLVLSGDKNSNLFSPSELLSNFNWICKNQINIWGTYEQNFLIGYFAKEFTDLRQAMIQDFFPSLIYPMIYPMIADISNNTLGDVNKSTFSEFWDNINPLIIFSNPTSSQKLLINTINLLKIFSTSIICENAIFGESSVINQETYFNNINKLNAAVGEITGNIDLPTETQGYQNNEYGIGLGELFIFIAIWVGCLTQTFVYDRRGRTKDTKWWQYYISKYSLMLATAWLQVTFLMASLLLLGFGKIGSSYALLWLWMYFMVFVFISIIFALWMLFRDEMFGRICAVIYLIINLAAGWGTFPSFMQNSIINAISYITPFRYGLHNMGIIVYGLPNPIISVGIGQYQIEILQNFGILCIWLAIFIPLGILIVYLKYLRFHYGTIKLSIILSVIKNNIHLFNNEKITTKINWRSLKLLSPYEQKQIKEIIINQLNKERKGKYDTRKNN